MNSSVYIFGNLSSGYTQYPDDYTRDILKTFYSNAKSVTQIAIYRDGNLMYYAYIRKLENNAYIGLCVVLNGIAQTRFDKMFDLFENVISNLVAHGYLIKFSEKGTLIPNAEHLYMNREEVDLVTMSLKGGFENLQSSVMKLPPINYAVGKETVKECVAEDNKEDILKSSYTNGYTYIYKSKGFDTTQINSYRGILSQMKKERDSYKDKCDSLSVQLSKVKAKQKNMLWVSIFGAVAFIFGVIIWNKVLYPSEVTHYETGEFVYYGPMKNNRPHGTGVAIYPTNDKYGRKYYIGNFVNGERQDTAAMLFYQDGDYYYGAMDGDNWDKGILYMNSDNSHFTGTFYQNDPWNGIWYDHKQLYKLIDGKKSYK